MYARILLPTDGSDAGHNAVDQAIQLASQLNASLHVLFVVENLPYAPEMVDDTVELQLQAIGEEALSEIESQATDAGIEVTTELRHGTPHRMIIEYAESNNCDLIVMGTHGRSGLDRYLLGSVTERVVRSSDTPVLTVRQSNE